VPSHSQTYALSDIENALESAHGHPVTVHCRRGQLSELWYHFNIAGSLQTGKFIPASPGSLILRKSLHVDNGLTNVTDGQSSDCPSRGIRYLPKRAQPEPTRTTTTGGSEPTATGIPFSGKGNMIVSTMDQLRGCIISWGTWYASGTCATFRAEKLSGSLPLQSPIS